MKLHPHSKLAKVIDQASQFMASWKVPVYASETRNCTIYLFIYCTDTTPTYVSTLTMDTNKLMDNLDHTNDDLHNLADKLKEEEAAKQRKPVMEEPLLASIKTLQEVR